MMTTVRSMAPGERSLPAELQVQSGHYRWNRGRDLAWQRLAASQHPPVYPGIPQLHERMGVIPVDEPVPVRQFGHLPKHLAQNLTIPAWGARRRFAGPVAMAGLGVTPEPPVFLGPPVPAPTPTHPFPQLPANAEGAAIGLVNRVARHYPSQVAAFIASMLQRMQADDATKAIAILNDFLAKKGLSGLGYDQQVCDPISGVCQTVTIPDAPLPDMSNLPSIPWTAEPTGIPSGIPTPISNTTPINYSGTIAGAVNPLTQMLAVLQGGSTVTTPSGAQAIYGSSQTAGAAALAGTLGTSTMGGLGGNMVLLLGIGIVALVVLGGRK